MLSESMAPPLANLGEFRKYVDSRGARVRRDYLPEFECDDGTVLPAFWQVVIWKEEMRSDGNFHVFTMTVDDATVESNHEPVWAATVELHEMGWQRYLEEAGVA
jgi:hypothetical protein